MSYAMPLAELLHACEITCDSQVVISGISLDSRNLGKGDLFVAYPGTQSDGRSYIAAAQKNGAAAVVYEAGDFELPESVTIPAYAVAGLQIKTGLLASHFYSHPSADMQVFGVTGTNGKTTCCYLLVQALNMLGLRAAMMGTLGVGELHNLAASGHTTPDPIAVQSLLAEWRDEGITQVCMEVSSHAIDQGRVNGIQFFCTLFTNLSHDHLDYHGNMQAYAATKQKLFSEFHSELVITNADDEVGAALIDIADADFIASFSAISDASDVVLVDAQLEQNGISLVVDANGVELRLVTPLVGKVNIPNVLMVVATLLALSTSLEDIKQIIAQLKPAPGRMELYPGGDARPNVIIDYAHTPDALSRALDSIHQHCHGQLWCVFGCGGDRDAVKRPAMGQVAEQFADQLIITNDNPRSEDPAEIARQIAEGINGEFEVVLDRAVAIKTAISRAKARDWVVIAGKGHETTQEIAGQMHAFSDRQQVLQALEAAA